MTYGLHTPRVSGNTSGTTMTWGLAAPLPSSAVTLAMVKRTGTSGSDPTPTGVPAGVDLLPGSRLIGGTFKTWAGVYAWRGGTGKSTVTVTGTSATTQIILVSYGGVTDADYAALVADSDGVANLTGTMADTLGVTAPADRDCVSVAFAALGGVAGGPGITWDAPWQKGEVAGGSQYSSTGWAEKVTPAGTTTTKPTARWSTSGVNALLVYTLRCGPLVGRRPDGSVEVVQGVWDTATGQVKPLLEWSFAGTPTEPTPTDPVVETREAALWPGEQTDPYNAPLAKTATYASPTEDKTARMRSKGSNGTVNRETWSIGVAIATDATPLATVTETDVSPNRVWSDTRIPTDFVPPPGSGGFADATSAFPQPNDVSHSYYKLAPKLNSDGTRVPNQWTTTRRITTDLRGSLIQSGIRASGNDVLAGLIRKWEADAISIRHAMVFSIPQGDLKLNPTGADGQVVNGKAVWPANTQDTQRTGMAYTGPIPMGSWFALDPAVNPAQGKLLNGTGLTALQIEVATAAQDYGAVVGDQSSTTALYLEPTATEAQEQEIRAVWREFIIPNLLRVTNIRSDNVGGGTWSAARRRPLAPPFTQDAAPYPATYTAAY